MGDVACNESVTRVSVSIAGIAVDVANDINDIPVEEGVAVGLLSSEGGIWTSCSDGAPGSWPRRSLRVAVLKPVLLPL